MSQLCQQIQASDWKPLQAEQGCLGLMRPDKALSSQKNTIRDLIKQGMRILDKHFEAFKLIGCVSEKLKNSKKLNFLFFFSISYDAPKAGNLFIKIPVAKLSKTSKERLSRILATCTPPRGLDWYENTRKSQSGIDAYRFKRSLLVMNETEKKHNEDLNLKIALKKGIVMANKNLKKN